MVVRDTGQASNSTVCHISHVFRGINERSICIYVSFMKSSASNMSLGVIYIRNCISCYCHIIEQIWLPYCKFCLNCPYSVWAYMGVVCSNMLKYMKSLASIMSPEALYTYFMNCISSYQHILLNKNGCHIANIPHTVLIPHWHIDPSPPNTCVKKPTATMT